MNYEQMVDEIDEILTSGYGTELMPIHKRSLKNKLSNLNQHDKDNVWNVYIDRLNQAKGEYGTTEEIEFISNLLGKDIPDFDWEFELDSIDEWDW